MALGLPTQSMAHFSFKMYNSALKKYRPKNSNEISSVICHIGQSLLKAGFKCQYIDFQMARIFCPLYRNQESNCHRSWLKNNLHLPRCKGVPQGSVTQGGGVFGSALYC